jgi:VWFA-related protein
MFMKAYVGILVLFALLSSFNNPSAIQTASSKPQATSLPRGADPVILPVTVISEKGRFVRGLSRDSFTFSIDKEPADVVDFREEDIPLSVGIVVDTSTSIVYEVPGRTKEFLIAALQKGLQRFLELGNKSNEYFLMAFSKQPELLVDWTSDSKSIIDPLREIRTKGSTTFNDACYLATDKVLQGRNSKRVLILISDGVDNASGHSAKQVREALKQSDVILYSVYFSRASIDGLDLALQGRQTLKELTSITGGLFLNEKEGFLLQLRDATWAFEVIATELRLQYTIGIMPKALSADNKWHKIKVSMNQPAKASGERERLYVRTREGFYLNRR